MGLKNAIGKFFGAVAGSNLTDYYGPNYQERAAFLQKLQDQELQLKALAMTREQQQIEADKQRMANEAVKTAIAVGPSLARAGRIQDPSFVGPRLEDAGLPNPNREGLLGEKLDLGKVVPGLDPEAAKTFSQMGEAEADRQDRLESDKRELDWAKVQDDLARARGGVSDRDRFMAEQRALIASLTGDRATNARLAARKSWVSNDPEHPEGYWLHGDGFKEFAKPGSGETKSADALRKEVEAISRGEADLKIIRDNYRSGDVIPLIGGMKEWWNSNMPEFAGGGDSRLAKVQAATARLASVAILALSGTAVSKQEQERLERFLAMPTNNEQTFIARNNLAAISFMVGKGARSGTMSPELQNRIIEIANDQSGFVDPVQVEAQARKELGETGALQSGTRVPGRMPGPSMPPAGVDPRAEDIFAKYDRPRQ